MFALDKGNKTRLHSTKETFLSNAIIEFISRAWISNQMTVNLIKGTHDSYQLTDIINRISIGTFLSPEIAIRVESANSLDYTPKRPKRCAIFFIETLADLMDDFNSI